MKKNRLQTELFDGSVKVIPSAGHRCPTTPVIDRGLTEVLTSPNKPTSALERSRQPASIIFPILLGSTKDVEAKTPWSFPQQAASSLTEPRPSDRLGLWRADESEATKARNAAGPMIT